MNVTYRDASDQIDEIIATATQGDLRTQHDIDELAAEARNYLDSFGLAPCREAFIGAYLAFTSAMQSVATHGRPSLTSMAVIARACRDASPIEVRTSPLTRWWRRHRRDLYGCAVAAGIAVVGITAVDLLLKVVSG